MSIKSGMDRILNRFLSGNHFTYKQIFSMLLPLVVDQAFVVCLNMLNASMVSSSGQAAIAAVSMVDSLNFFLMQMFIALATGGTVVVAQYKGSGSRKMVQKSAAQALSAVLVTAAAICAVVTIFHTPILNGLFNKAEEDVLANARLYLTASALSYPCFGLYEASCGVLRGTGKTKSSLILSVIYNITYVLCNVLFINVLKMGVKGLSISLNVSRFLGMVCSLGYLCIFERELGFKIKNMLKFDFAMIKKILYIGIPFAAEQMFFNGGKMLTQTFIVSLGTASMTVFAISSTLTPLFQIGANSLSLGVVTVVGQCIGSGDISDARKFIKSFLLLGSISFVVMVVIIMPIFYPIVGLFHPDEAILPTIHKIMIITAVTQPILWSQSFILPSALRAAGDSTFTSVASLLSMWLFRVVMGYVFGITLGFGIVGVWCAMIGEWGVRGIIFCLRLRTEQWYLHKVI